MLPLGTDTDRKALSVGAQRSPQSPALAPGTFVIGTREDDFLRSVQARTLCQLHLRTLNPQVQAFMGRRHRVRSRSSGMSRDIADTHGAGLGSRVP